MLVADLPPVPAQETPIVWVQTVPRSGEDGARLGGVRNEATCGAMPVGYCALRGLPHQSPPVLVAAATTSSAARSPGKLYGSLGVCYPASNVKGAVSSFGPADAAESVFAIKEYPLYENDYPAFVEYSKTSTIEVLQQPEHGDMTRKTTAPKLFQYTPNTGYKGTDKAVFLVTLGEHKVKVIYFIKVIDTEMTTYNHEAIYRKYCPKPTEWLISSEQGGSPLLSQFLDFSGLLGRVNLSFADLPGTAVAQTTARVGRNNQRALRRMKNLPILAPCLIIDAPGTRAAQKPPSVI